MQQAITWTAINQVLWHHMASLGHNEWIMHMNNIVKIYAPHASIYCSSIYCTIVAITILWLRYVGRCETNQILDKWLINILAAIMIYDVYKLIFSVFHSLIFSAHECLHKSHTNQSRPLLSVLCSSYLIVWCVHTVGCIKVWSCGNRMWQWLLVCVLIASYLRCHHSQYLYLLQVQKLTQILLVIELKPRIFFVKDNSFAHVSAAFYNVWSLKIP